MLQDDTDNDYLVRLSEDSLKRGHRGGAGQGFFDRNW